MTDRYVVWGNPVAHSKSPFIHARFAAATGQDMSYRACLAPLDGFAAAVAAFAAAGGRGGNVTVPFKEEAFGLCTRRTERAERAGAVNTLAFNGSEIVGDNTDGAGLLDDLENNLGIRLAQKRIALLGAGGAARGALAPLLAARPRSIRIANLSLQKAEELAAGVADLGRVEAGGYEALAGQLFDVVINATSASLAGARLPLPPGIFASGSLAYDMMYGQGETPFLADAHELGASRCADGLGMLVGQAAEAFFVWRGVRPETAPVLTELRALLAAA